MVQQFSFTLHLFLILHFYEIIFAEDTEIFRGYKNVSLGEWVNAMTQYVNIC